MADPPVRARQECFATVKRATGNDNAGGGKDDAGGRNVKGEGWKPQLARLKP